MTANTETMRLFTSVFKEANTLNLFTAIASQRIADKSSLKINDTSTDRQLDSLAQADLIGASSKRDKFYVTAKGLQVARELAKLTRP